MIYKEWKTNLTIICVCYKLIEASLEFKIIDSTCAKYTVGLKNWINANPLALMQRVECFPARREKRALSEIFHGKE